LQGPDCASNRELTGQQNTAESPKDNVNTSSAEAAALTQPAANADQSGMTQQAPVLVTEIAGQASGGDTQPMASIDAVKRRPKKPVIPRKCTVSPQRLATLESLSYEIMTNTLPINKMKRILPNERVSVHDQWPMLSNYRKQTVLPGVKAGKQKLTEDMGKLHTKINEYFSCDNFPLWQYKYIPKEYPRKYRLLKAIETEDVTLPNLPKR